MFARALPDNPGLVSRLSLDKPFYILLVIGFLNGLYARAAFTIQSDGWATAIVGTFGISLIVWVGLYLALELSREIEFERLRPLDVAVILAYCLCLTLPVTGLSWIAMTGLSVYFLVVWRDNKTARRVLFVTLALSFSLFWSPMVFRAFMPYILRVDTFLVAGLTQAESYDNLIRAADGKTVLKVLEGCTSFNNMSLAFLAWIIARSHYGTSGVGRTILFVGMSCLAVVAVNTTRIGLIVLRPDLYDILHGNFGASVANLAMTLIIGYISYQGARR